VIFISNIISFLSPSRLNNKKIFVLVILLMTALLIDVSLIKVYDLISKSSDWDVSVFILIVSVYAIGQYLILQFVKRITIRQHRIKMDLHFSIIQKVITLAQYGLIVILVLVSFEMILRSYYDVLLLIISTYISYTVAIIMLALLAKRFLSWFKTNKNSIVLMYGLSAIALLFNAGFSVISLNNVLIDKPSEVRPNVAGTTIYIPQDSISYALAYANIISSIISFVLIWGATAMLLRHYSQRLGSVKYWILLSIPLIYFLSQFLSLFLNLFGPLLDLNPIFFGVLLTLIFTLSKPVGGFLFGIAFWTVARSIKPDNIVKNYLIISGYGFLFLFLSDQATTLVSTPYPPFGLTTISMFGLSSYLILVGIYSSAISVAADSELRRSIRRFAIKKSSLLDSIGLAQMEQEIENRVLDMTKQQQEEMIKQTGLSSSLSQEEVREYLDLVLKEIKRKDIPK
jgi:hypothetical protein